MNLISESESNAYDPGNPVFPFYDFEAQQWVTHVGHITDMTVRSARSLVPQDDETQLELTRRTLAGERPGYVVIAILSGHYERKYKA